MLVVLAAVAGAEPDTPEGYRIGLEGQWRFMLDSSDRGITDRVWQTRLPDAIRLPGTTDTGRYGDPAAPTPPNALRKRMFTYVGPAWYQRDFVVPDSWRRRRLTLYLERCHWETRVWLDGRCVGARDSLSTPHIYELSTLAVPGTHTLTIRVDNRLKYDLGRLSNSVSEMTQTNWNGIVGRIELRGTARVWIDTVQAYPDLRRGQLRIRARIGNVTETRVTATVRHQIMDPRRQTPMAAVTFEGTVDRGYAWVEGTLPLTATVPRWTAGEPTTCVLHSDVSATNGTTTWVNRCDTPLGLREISSQRGLVTVNGSPVLLRGAVDRCVFPATGHPPMTEAAWEPLFRKLKEYGLNHLRFDTWCPPEAAFDAADAAGILLLVEAPAHVTDLGRNAPRDAFVRNEAARICDTYGDHPSFAMLSLGASVSGEPGYLDETIRALKKRDARRLYAASSAGTATPADDFAVVPVPPPAEGQVNAVERAEGAVPVIAHEVGKRIGFPDISLIGKHTGVTRAYSLMAVQEMLRNSGTLEYAVAFARSVERTAFAAAHGGLERLLMTGALAGYHLDGFIGGQTAENLGPGVIDVFWADTGAVAPAEMRRWCADTVPLADIRRRVLSTRDSLDAEVALAHYGTDDIPAGTASWRVVGDGETVIAQGDTGFDAVPAGSVRRLGHVVCPLAGVKPPARLYLEVSLPGHASGRWPVWVYSPEDEGPFAEGVYVTRRLSREALERLKAGGRVLLLADAAAIRWSVPARLAALSAGSNMGILGILCEPASPAFRGFPTEEWADAQWYDLLERSRCIVLQHLQPGPYVFIRGIDRAERCLPLGLAFECKVGDGKLAVCSVDLISDMAERHEARQLLKSLLDYVASDGFRPETAMSVEDVARVLRTDACEVVVGAPTPEPDKAGLWVRAGALRTKQEEAPWANDADIVVVHKEGFDYAVAGDTVVLAVGTAWTSKQGLFVNLVLPPATTGNLSVRLRTSDTAPVIVQLQLSDTLHETVVVPPEERGIWVSLPLREGQAHDGQVKLSLESEGAPVLVTELALLPDGAPQPK